MPTIRDHIDALPVEDDHEEEDRFDALPSSSAIRALAPQIAEAAQEVYDAWDQSDPDNDELNGGGICHLIADKIVSILWGADIPCSSQTASDVQHVYVVAQCSDGVFEVDIPYRIYETGSMFTWTKRPGVVFGTEHVVVEKLDWNPARMNVYVEDWEEE
jgi:hypothetical protein